MAVAPNSCLQPTHLFERFIDGVVSRIVHRLLGAPDGDRRLGCNLNGALQCRFHSLFVGFKNGVEQAVAQRLVSAHASSGVGQFFHHGQRY